MESILGKSSSQPSCGGEELALSSSGSWRAENPLEEWSAIQIVEWKGLVRAWPFS